MTTGRRTRPLPPGIVLASVILLATAAPAAGQMAYGVRAGIGGAWMATPSGVHFSPCPPDTDCPSAADEGIRGLTFGADIDIPISNSGGVFGFRIGAAYTGKGGAGSGYDAHGEPDSGTISTSYLQFSMLLRARSERSPSMVFLAGPWVGSQMSCEKEGDLAVDCEGTDAGIALGAGVELALPGSSSASVGVEAIYYRGLREHSGYEETTRFAGVQVGFAYKIG